MTNKPPETSGIRALKAHKENPYMELLTGDKKARREILYDGNRAMLNVETGEVEESLAIARVKWVEPDQFVKIYLKEHSVFFDLTKVAQRCCEYLMARMGDKESIGNDCIVLFHDEFRDYFAQKGQTTGTSANSFNRGMRELAAKKLIAKAHRRDHWFINPTIFFNGDRARFTTEYRKKKTTEQEKLEAEGQQRLLD